MVQKNEVPVIAAINERWSPRSFSGRGVPKESLVSLFEAARWAPSAHNEQPWRFIVATSDEKEDLEKALSCLNEGNQMWAKNAPVLILTFAKKQFELNERINNYAWHDLALAEAFLMVQATSLGLHLHPMAGIKKDRISEIYDSPEGFEPVTAIAVGYLGKPEDLPESVEERDVNARSRRPLDEIVFTGNWGKNSGAIFD